MADPLLGKQLGDYVIQELLGRGGMARVYKGYDERLQRFAAVKVINSDNAPLADQAEYAERFRREARAIARLHHPNIVGVFQFGEYETNYYMAMVFVEGKDLRHLLKENAEVAEKMPYDEVLNIIRGISSALDYAHSRGVIHRDIKPSNIMLDNEDRAILTDFGLALNTQEGTLGDTFGSAHYIAPEQAVSSAKAVPQSDLYSLGVCLYEMLAGKVPFDDPSAMSVALKHLNDAPPPPRLFNPDLPPAAERVILKILDKDPDQRYESGALLTQALEQALFGDASESTFQMPVAKPADANRSTAATDSQLKTPAPFPAPVAIKDDSNSAKQQRVRQASGAEDNISTTSSPDATSPNFGGPSTRPFRDMPTAGAVNSRAKILISLLIVILLLGIGAIFVANNASGGSAPTTTLTSVALVGTGPATSSVAETTGASGTSETSTIDPLAIATETATEQSTQIVSGISTKTIPPSKTAIPTKTTVPSRTPIPSKTPTAAPTTLVPSTIDPLSTGTSSDNATSEVGGKISRIVLTYDNYQFVLTNASGNIVNLDKLRFLQLGETEATNRSLDTTLWYAPGSQYTPRALPPRLCLQVYRNDRLQPTPSADCTEVFRAAWAKVAEGRRFWIADKGQADTFQVFMVDELLATCDIAAGHCEFTVKS